MKKSNELKIQGMRNRLVDLLFEAIEHGNNGEAILAEIRWRLEDLMKEGVKHE